MSIFKTSFIHSDVEDKLNIMDKLEWLKDRKTLVSLFGEDIVRKALFFVDWEDVVDTVKHYSKPDTPHFVIEVKKETKYEMRSGTLVPKTYDVYEMFVPSQYQSDIVTFIIKYAFSILYPWFDSFEWNIYGNSLTEKSDIYLVTEFGSLYVPLKALTNKDYSLVEERHSEYHKMYYRGKDEELEESLRILESTEAKKLKSYLK
jgi:hypothetical protein